MKRPKVSIITVNYKARDYLRNYFESLKKSNFQDFEIIFVDNASSDGSVEFIKELTSSRVKDPPAGRAGLKNSLINNSLIKNKKIIKLIENKENIGFVLANNQVVKRARGEYLFFLNDDTKVGKAAIGTLVEAMEKNPRLGIVGCRMMDYQEKKRLHTGIGVDIFGYPIVSPKVFYIEGSALMIKKKLFEQIGGFDPQYFMFHDDVDLAWRVWLLGYQARAFDQAIVCHAVGASAGGGPRVKGRYRSSYLRRYYSERNNIRTLLKNYRFRTLLLILPLYFLINLGEVIFYLLIFKFKLIYLCVKAYFWNILNLKDTLKKRKVIQKNRVISDWEIIRKMVLGCGKLVALRKAGLPEFR